MNISQKTRVRELIPQLEHFQAKSAVEYDHCEVFFKEDFGNLIEQTHPETLYGCDYSIDSNMSAAKLAIQIVTGN